MQRLANFDISENITSPGAKLAAQIGFGFACALLMIAIRSGLDMVAPTSGPFALVYPTVLIATLYGHWQAGLTAHVTSFLWAWYFVLAPVNSFEFEVASDPARVVINVAATAIIGIFAEVFRRAVTSATSARDEEIERRGMLLAELDHRTKNNFALVVSLLELQRRRAETPETDEALGDALNRVHTFAKAYTNLSDIQGEGSMVEMSGYLREVVRAADAAMFSDEVTVSISADECTLPRQTAVAIGLFVNEALTNSAKYAFPDGRAGKVAVRFSCDHDQTTWQLSVSDDGVGVQQAQGKRPDSGLGSNLMNAFARQAEAEIVTGEPAGGYSIGLVSEPR